MAAQNESYVRRTLRREAPLAENFSSPAALRLRICAPVVPTEYACAEGCAPCAAFLKNDRGANTNARKGINPLIASLTESGERRIIGIVSILIFGLATQQMVHRAFVCVCSHDLRGDDNND